MQTPMLRILALAVLLYERNTFGASASNNVNNTSTGENAALSVRHLGLPPPASHTHGTKRSHITAVASTTIGHQPTPTTDTARLDLSTSFQNKTFLPIVVDGQDVPVFCVNCSTSGVLHVSGTELSVTSDFSNDDDGVDIEGGVFTARLPQGLKGRIELSLTAPSSLSHNFNLLTIPFAGFAVPGLADAGVFLNISVQLGIAMLQPATVSFGFEFGLAENSSVLIDVADPENSTVKGFENDTRRAFNLLPVIVSKPGLDVKITAGLVLDLAIGAKMLDNDVDVSVGAAVQIPRLAITERQLDNVDNACDPTKNTTTTRPDAASELTVEPRDRDGRLIGNYTNIIPAVGMDVSVYAETGLKELFGTHELGLRRDITIFNTALSQSTICINNHNVTSKASKVTKTTAMPTTTPAPTSTQNRGSGTTGSSESTSTKSSEGTRPIFSLDLGDELVQIRSSTALAFVLAMTCLVTLF